jgi:hypothetical protein
MARNPEGGRPAPEAGPAGGDLSGYTIDELRALRDAGTASGPSENGPMVMERLRRKIQAGTTSTAYRRDARPRAAAH